MPNEKRKEKKRQKTHFVYIDLSLESYKSVTDNHTWGLHRARRRQHRYRLLPSASSALTLVGSWSHPPEFLLTASFPLLTDTALVINCSLLK